MVQVIRERWKGPEIHKKSSEQFFYQFKKSWDFWCRNKDTLRNKVYGEIAGLQNDKQEKSYKRNKTLALNSILDTSTYLLRL